MTEPLDTSSTMQTDHQHWKQEHDAWRNDVALWQQEYDAMRSALEQLQQAVERHGEALRRHTDAINNHEAALALHDRVIAERETGHERPGLGDAGTADHQRQAVTHFEQRQLHEKMKREHYTLVAQLEVLDSMFGQSAPGAP